jgi:hypothetical protein
LENLSSVGILTTEAALIAKTLAASKGWRHLDCGKLPTQKGKRLLTLQTARPHSAAKAGWGPGSLGPPFPLHTAPSRYPSRLAAARAYSDLQRKMRVEGLRCDLEKPSRKTMTSRLESGSTSCQHGRRLKEMKDESETREAGPTSKCTTVSLRSFVMCSGFKSGCQGFARGLINGCRD